MGLGQSDAFDTIDLYEARDMTKVCVRESLCMWLGCLRQLTPHMLESKLMMDHVRARRLSPFPKPL